MESPSLMEASPYGTCSLMELCDRVLLHHPPLKTKSQLGDFAPYDYGATVALVGSVPTGDRPFLDSHYD